MVGNAIDRSFPVRHPDIFDLHRVVEEPPALALPCVEPVDGAAFVGEHLLQISNGQCLCSRGARFVSEIPDGVHIVVLR